MTRTHFKYFVLALVSFFAILTVARISTSIYRQVPFLSTSLPVYTIESWTFGSFSTIENSLGFYREKSDYNSPIYMKLPYQINYYSSVVISKAFDVPVVVGNRILNIFYSILSGLIVFVIVSFLTKFSWLSLVISLAVFPMAFDLYHIGFAFPHEVTKAFLMAWLGTEFYFLFSGTRNIYLSAFLITIAPFFRQTYLIISLFIFITSLLPFLFSRVVATKKISLIFISITTLAIAIFLLFKGSDFKNVVFWIFRLPGSHPRRWDLIPEINIKICCYSFVLSSFAVWLTRERIKRPIAIVGLVFTGALVCLVHSSKQASGSHMTDTVVFITILIIATCSVICLSSKELKMLPVLFLAISVYLANRGFSGQTSLWRIDAFVSGIRLENERRLAEITIASEEIKSLKDTISLYDIIPGYENLEAGPWMSSLVDTSYSQPRYDINFWLDEKLKNLGQVFYAGDYLFFKNSAPENCSVEKIKEYDVLSSSVVRIKCL